MRSVRLPAQAILVIGLVLSAFGRIATRPTVPLSDLRLERQDSPAHVSFHTSSSKLPGHRLGLRKSSEPAKPLLVAPVIAAAALETQSNEPFTSGDFVVHDSSVFHHSPRAPPAAVLL